MADIFIVLFIQIILECLPISSSGHIYFLQKIFFQNVEWTELLDHLTHAPTLLILMIFFKNDWLPLIKKLLHIKPKCASYRRLLRIFFKIIGLVFITDCITVLFYFGFKIIAWPDLSLIASIGFLITGLSLLSLCFIPNYKSKEHY